MTLRNDIQIAIIKSYEVGSDTTTEQIISIFQERFDEIRSVLPKHPRSEITSTHRSIFDEIERLCNLESKPEPEIKDEWYLLFQGERTFGGKVSIGIQEFQGSLDDIIDTTVKDIYLALANKSAELKPEPEMPKQQEAINPETHSKERKIARILLSLVGGNMPGKDAYDHIIDLVD